MFLFCSFVKFLFTHTVSQGFLRGGHVGGECLKYDSMAERQAKKSKAFALLFERSLFLFLPLRERETRNEGTYYILNQKQSCFKLRILPAIGPDIPARKQIRKLITQVLASCLLFMCDIIAQNILFVTCNYEQSNNIRYFPVIIDITLPAHAAFFEKSLNFPLICGFTPPHCRRSDPIIQSGGRPCGYRNTFCQSFGKIQKKPRSSLTG